MTPLVHKMYSVTCVFFLRATSSPESSGIIIRNVGKCDFGTSPAIFGKTGGTGSGPARNPTNAGPTSLAVKCRTSTLIGIIDKFHTFSAYFFTIYFTHLKFVEKFSFMIVDTGQSFLWSNSSIKKCKNM